MKKAFILILLALVSAAMLLVSCADTDDPDAVTGETTENTAPIEWAEHDFAMTVVNVGYGDSIILQIDSYVYMIDTGSKESVAAVLGAMELLGIDKLDGLILTHTHSDHIGGAKAVADNYKVKCLYSASISENEKNGTNKIVKIGSDNKLPHTRLHAGDKITVMSDVYFDVLGPIVKNNEDDNDNSLVLRLFINGVTVLLTGDMQFTEEKTIMDTGVSFDADVLKVANHGNSDATSKTFAEAATPLVSLISTSVADAPDSSSQRVRTTLADSNIYITENYEYGIYITIDGESTISVNALEGKKSELSLSVSGIDADAQSITLRNDGDEADVSGVIITDGDGNAYVLPDKTTLEAGGELTVVCADKSNGDESFIWKAEAVWGAKNGDEAFVFDSGGNEITSYKSGE